MKFSIINKLALLFLCITLGFSCSKSTDDNGGGGNKYYVKFQADGEKREYSGVAVMSFTQQPDYVLYQLSGLKSSTEIIGMSMTITTDKVIQPPASFTTEPWQSSSGVSRISLLLGIHDEDKLTYVSFVAGAQNYPATATITELTNDHIKGNFSGKVTNSSFTKSIDITNGEFYLKRQ